MKLMLTHQDVSWNKTESVARRPNFSTLSHLISFFLSSCSIDSNAKLKEKLIKGKREIEGKDSLSDNDDALVTPKAYKYK